MEKFTRPSLFILFLGIHFSTHSSIAASVEPYGFIRATLISSSQAVDSFGNTNMTAPVKAAPSSANNSTYRSSFEFAQTRAGIRIPGDKINGVIEVDFIDFTKATAGTKALPRLRLAIVNYKLSETQLLEIGQDWDIFSPTKPSTYNFVGLYFNAGNSGFMRPQIKYKQDISRIRFNGSYSAFYGLNAFAEVVPWTGGSIHTEIYYGDKLGNSGALTLAQATSAQSLTEAGAI